MLITFYFFNSSYYQEISVLKEDLSSHISFTNNCIADLQTALEENSEAGKVTHRCLFLFCFYLVGRVFCDM